MSISLNISMSFTVSLRTPHDVCQNTVHLINRLVKAGCFNAKYRINIRLYERDSPSYASFVPSSNGTNAS